MRHNHSRVASPRAHAAMLRMRRVTLSAGGLAADRDVVSRKTGRNSRGAKKKQPYYDTPSANPHSNRLGPSVSCRRVMVVSVLAMFVVQSSWCLDVRSRHVPTTCTIELCTVHLITRSTRVQNATYTLITLAAFVKSS